MKNQHVLTWALAGVIVIALVPQRVGAADDDLLPPRLPKEQRENLLRFLQQHEKPDRYVPADARIIGGRQDIPPPLPAPEKGKSAPIKQYLVQITPHRPVPGQEQVNRVDVYYYRPNPEK